MQTIMEKQDLAPGVSKPKPKVRGFVTISEDERLIEDSKRPGIEKLQLFTKMLRRNVMFDKATRFAETK